MMHVVCLYQPSVKTMLAKKTVILKHGPAVLPALTASGVQLLQLMLFLLVVTPKSLHGQSLFLYI